jgi:hypothetical protein
VGPLVRRGDHRDDGDPMENPFGTGPSRPDVVRFASILSRAGRGKVCLPIAIPEDGEWFVRIVGMKNRFVFGVYRRHMKTISYLGQIDELLGAPASARFSPTRLARIPADPSSDRDARRVPAGVAHLRV